MVRAIRCPQLNTKTSIINGSEVSRLSVAIQFRSEGATSATSFRRSDIRILQLHYLSWLFLMVHFLAKLRCPHVSYVSAFTKDFLAPCLELLQGFQHVVLIQTSL